MAGGKAVFISLLGGAHYRPLENRLLTVLWIHVKVPLQTETNKGLFAHRSEWLRCQTEVFNGGIVCLQILGEICVAFRRQSKNPQI